MAFKSIIVFKSMEYDLKTDVKFIRKCPEYFPEFLYCGCLKKTFSGISQF